MKKRTRNLMIMAACVLGISVLAAGCGQKDSGTASDSGSASVSVGDQVKYEIIGIDPGAGLMQATSKAMEEYGLTDWKLMEGSGAAMTAALEKAYKDQKPIIVTGWTPHWMFAKYDLKYLEDPKNVYGGDEQIHTIVRNGLKDEHPSAYAMLDRFEWTPDDMAKVMVDVQEGKKPEEAAAAWLNDNAAKADEWVKDLPKEEGKSLKLAYVAWDSEIASTNVVKQVLEARLGYKVDLLQVEAGPMWAGVAGGDADAIVAAWLPTTHKDYFDKFKDKLEDLGPNLNGTKIGLVVPQYMDINSIEDLKKTE
ncbi:MULTISPECIES: glycine betaine ABC transporter substrate-binding protein [unclassified Paenibacillus]|uniref:glycine betaine ABC transporter substrate-binding protein n=1 Tax=unclassified Paenibacillus TaxID=185978 RepID=UPI001B53DCBD|nr:MULTISPECIES: glycine betaine ABC transporter substrate-binding protein [unclassified Paenibacillus]MBP1156723.1 glycine betaine/proline transport system substrate-binding protein [Paenibacillus sp. PvP091]MBP1172539.1 glycine betaine/proline transport system substrate-binding protein [Paenibacillus sp. PvR098]MBP2438919.1 glycine betaine/proline transport system substrate-binding protein [Paenibacillus sp. PvP052]